MVRLPIGYWQVVDDSAYVGGCGELEWFMKMAKKYNLKVLICLHAAPGAQNASDHSGSGKPGQVRWFSLGNMRKTTKILETLANRYGHQSALWGIELLNEPLISNWFKKWAMLAWCSLTLCEVITGLHC